MKQWSIVAVLAVTFSAITWPANFAAASTSCTHPSSYESSAAPAGCPWKGPLIVNSDHNYWIRASNGHTVLAAHIQNQCRIAAQFTLSGSVTAYPHSVGLISYQMEDTVAQVIFYLTSGPPKNELKKEILAFNVVPWVSKITQSGSVTTKLPASGGTDVTLPAEYRFPSFFYYLNNERIAEAPAATLSCGSSTGKSTKIHLANRYGSRGNPYTATQMHDSSTIEYPIPTTYKYSAKAIFPEKTLLVSALKILDLKYPSLRGEKFDPQTVAEMQGKKRTGTATLGLTRYAIGQSNLDEMPMTRPTPCQ